MELQPSLVPARHLSSRRARTRRRFERATQTELRRAGGTALVLLVGLNVADVVLTRLLLTRGGIELNPVADRLLASNTTLIVKLGIIGLFAALFFRHRAHLITVCLLWLVAGVYFCVVMINGSQLIAVW